MREEILIQIPVTNEGFNFNGRAIKSSVKNCIYTVVKINGKIVRIFNQVKVSEGDGYWISYNSIEPTSDVFEKLKTQLTNS